MRRHCIDGNVKSVVFNTYTIKKKTRKTGILFGFIYSGYEISWG